MRGGHPPRRHSQTERNSFPLLRSSVFAVNLIVAVAVKERVGQWFRRCPVCEVRRMCFQRLVEPQELPAYRLMLASGRACFDTS